MPAKGRGAVATAIAESHPMAARVVVSVSSGSRAVLYQGDVIGRLPSAALFLDDPRISEGHAMVSLRKGALVLLSLRRMLRVEGRPLSEVELRRGLVVELAEGLCVTVVDVHAPAEVLGLESPELGRRMLAPVASLITGPPPRLAARHVADAAAHLWVAGTSWRVRVGSGPVRVVDLGDVFEVGGQRFRLCSMPIAGVAGGATEPDGGIGSPLRVTAAYDSVELARRGREPLRLTGVAARLVSELVIFAAPVQWEVLAREVWPGDDDSQVLRHRLDSALHRLRRRLRDGGIRADLVSSDGGGQVWLSLEPHDTVDDRT